MKRLITVILIVIILLFLVPKLGNLFNVDSRVDISEVLK